MIRAVPGLTLTLDYTHSAHQGVSDKDVEPMIEYASHFHVRGGFKGRLQSSFRENAIDYGRIVTAMCKTNYAGWIGVEYVWIDWKRRNECDNLSETIFFRDFFRNHA